MLEMRTVLRRDAVTVSDVACRHECGRGDAEETGERHVLVFARRGCFVRSAGGVTAVIDPTLAYCANPGEEHRVDHPYPHGDDCTAISLDRGLVDALWGGEATLPPLPLRTSPGVDLEHRLLLAACWRGAEPHELEERAIGLAAHALERADARRVQSGRPVTERARRALADGARELLAEEPDRSLPELAGALAVSPHHLSRVFRALTGHTISRHRMRLRVRAAMERLAAGEGDLSRLAAELGFADQSHLHRVVRAETGHTPAALRRVLA